MHKVLSPGPWREWDEIGEYNHRTGTNVYEVPPHHGGFHDRALPDKNAVT